MVSGVGKGWGAVGVNIVVTIIGMLFIVNSVRCDYIMVRWGLGTYSIDYYGVRTFMLTGEGVIHWGWNIFIFLVLDEHTHDITKKISISPDWKDNIV